MCVSRRCGEAAVRQTTGRCASGVFSHSRRSDLGVCDGAGGLVAVVEGTLPAVCLFAAERSSLRRALNGLYRSLLMPDPGGERPLIEQK